MSRGAVGNFYPVAEIDADELRRHVRELVDRETDGE